MMRINTVEMPIFYLQFEGTPRSTHPQTDQIGGAFINCWIKAVSIEDAIHIARLEIEGWRWIIDEPDEAYEVDQTSYLRNPEGREHFEQAVIDDAVYVFYNWPANELGE